MASVDLRIEKKAFENTNLHIYLFINYTRLSWLSKDLVHDTDKKSTGFFIEDDKNNINTSIKVDKD